MPLPPTPSPFLCLHLEFDLSSVPNRGDMLLRDYTSAVAKVLAETKLLPYGSVAARARDVPCGTVSAVQEELFDDWSVSETHPVKLDFCYALSHVKAQLCVRVLTDLRHCDGVT